MLQIDLHCHEALGTARLLLTGTVDFVGTPGNPAYLCHLNDSRGGAACSGRVEGWHRYSEPLTGLAARCVAAAVSSARKPELLSASGQGSVVLRLGQQRIEYGGFGFAGRRLQLDGNSAVPLARREGHWGIASRVLSLWAFRQTEPPVLPPAVRVPSREHNGIEYWRSGDLHSALAPVFELWAVGLPRPDVPGISDAYYLRHLRAFLDGGEDACPTAGATPGRP